MDNESEENDYDSSTLRYMKMGQVYSPERRSEFEGSVKQWLRKYITTNHSNEDVVICIAPGHKAGDQSSFMYDLIRQFISENDDLNLEDGCDLLERYKTIPKQATAGANRNEQTHRDSIRIKDGEVNNRGKIVIILDDVWTSGCTARVCEEKIRTTGPKDVKLLAIGRTVPRMYM